MYDWSSNIFIPHTNGSSHTNTTLETTAVTNRRISASKANICPDICYEYPCQNPVGSELATTAKHLLIEMKSQSYQWWWRRGPSRRWWRWRRRRWWRRWWHRHPLGFLASHNCEKYSQSLCPWGEGREEKEKWKNKKKKKDRNLFIHCKLKIGQISSSQQTEDFYTALLPKLQHEQPHYSYDDNIPRKSKLTDLDQCHEYQMHGC